MPHRFCPGCGSDISHRHAKAIYCSGACRRWVSRGHTELRIRPAGGCGSCGASLNGRMITALYCSTICKTRAVESRRVRDDAARYLREREHRLAYATDYARANPHVGQATKRKRRAALAGAGTFRFTSTDWLRMQRRFGFRCAYCHQKRPLTMDHVIPVIRGGTHSAGNIIPACGPCNSRKQGRFITEWKYGKSRRIA